MMAKSDQEFMKMFAEEKKYYEEDSKFGFWVIFGEKSGHNYGEFRTEKQAQSRLNELSKQ